MTRALLRVAAAIALCSGLTACPHFLPVALTALGAVSSAESLGHDVLGIDFSIAPKEPAK